MEEQKITAKVIAHSKSSINGKEIITFELIYPRFIHSELMTHRLFSRNAASSRAIPVAKMIEQVRENPAMPVHWGKNQPGMQAKEELTGFELEKVQEEWKIAATCATIAATYMDDSGAHKQIVNRVLEPFQWMKTVVTATEFDNWFWLRNHPDAQPEIKELAAKMWEALQSSEAVELEPGDWHVPYYQEGFWTPARLDTVGWFDIHGSGLEDALAISSSCCAQVSYRKLDDSLEKARDIYKRLVESEPVHASPFEHQSTPMKKTHAYGQAPDFHPSEKGTCNHPESVLSWEEGITHADRKGNLWSGNFKGWIQHRQLIPNNACWEYTQESVKE